MEAITNLIVAGGAGGLIVAIALGIYNWRASVTESAAVPSEPVSTDIINIARIRVAGIGGFGVAAAGLVVAIFLPGVRAPIAIGFALGTLVAAILIMWRRKAGPLPSSGARIGASTTLSIDTPDRSTMLDDRRRGVSRESRL